MLRGRDRGRGSKGGSGGGGSLLPGNSTVVITYGDSLEGQAAATTVTNGTSTSNECSYLSRNYQNWNRVLDPRGKWDFWFAPDASPGPEGVNYIGQNKGVGGDQTSDMQGAARLNDLLAMIAYVVSQGGTPVVGIGGGTNDLNASSTAAAIMTRLTNIYTQVLNAGARIIIVTVPPRPTSVWSSGGAIRTQWLALSPLMQAYADANPTRVKIVRRDLICSNADADRTPITGYLESDNVHLTPIGGYHVAVDSGGWNEKLASWIAPYTYAPADVVSGDLWLNPTFTGTGGSVSGTGMTGIIADNCQLRLASGTGVACVGSKVAGGQQLVFTRDGTGGIVNITFGSPSGTLTNIPATGSWIRGYVSMTATASTQWQGVCMRLRTQPTVNGQDSQSMKTDTGLPWPSYAIGGVWPWQQTNPIQIPSGVTSFLSTVNFSIDNSVTGVDTVVVSRMHILPIIDPRDSLGIGMSWANGTLTTWGDSTPVTWSA